MLVHFGFVLSPGINLNLWQGVAMILFGGVMFYLGRQQKWLDDPVTPQPSERGDGPRHERAKDL